MILLIELIFVTLIDLYEKPQLYDGKLIFMEEATVGYEDETDIVLNDQHYVQVIQIQLNGDFYG